MFKLRDYQGDALTVIHNDLKSEPVALLQAVTGTGKTVMMARMINRYWHETDRSFLCLMHKENLVTQFRDTFESMTDVPFNQIGICCASHKQRDISKRLTISTVQTFVNQLDKYPGCSLLIIDEAHRVSMEESQYSKVIDTLRAKRPNMRILGITATPARLGHGFIYGDKCRKGSTNLFPRLNHRIKYHELEALGFLVPMHGKIANADGLTHDLSTVRVNGDYQLNQLGEVMSREIHLQTAVDAIKEHCADYKKICVFCCTIDHAEKLKELIKEQLEPCLTIHSQLAPLERCMNLNAWKDDGDIRITTSVNILAEGFDYPPLDCLVFARPTMSSSLYLQALGRALRISPETGKDHAFILDLTDNTARFGTDIDRMRVTVPKVVEDAIKKEQENYKLCPMCEREVVIAFRTCPHPDCGFEWPIQEYLEAIAVPDLGEVKFEKTPPETFEILDMTAYVHESKKNGDSKFLGRVELTYEQTMFFDRKVSLWFCFEDYYSAGAVAMGEKKWADISNEEYPETVEGFNDVIDLLKQPESIVLDMSGEYPEILEVIKSEDLQEYEKYETMVDTIYDDVPF